MMTHTYLEAGVKNQIQHQLKICSHNSYRLVSLFKVIGAITKEISGIFSTIATLDLVAGVKGVKWQPFGFEKGQNYSQAGFCVNLMKLGAIFKVLDHLNDFQTSSYGSHFFFFLMRTKFFCTCVFIAINNVCKFGEDILINDVT